MTTPAFYVRREKDGREGWVGPIRPEAQAEREKDAWQESGWVAEVHPATAELRHVVNAWQRAAREAR